MSIRALDTRILACTRWIIYISGLIALYASGIIAAICGTVSLTLWVFLPQVCRIEKKVLYIVFKIKGEYK